jgi:hypothetical protein
MAKVATLSRSKFSFFPNHYVPADVPSSERMNGMERTSIEKNGE